MAHFKYKPEFDELAYKYCLLGAGNNQLASFFNVSPEAIDGWLAEDGTFAYAVKAGREDADATVAQSLFKRATGYVGKKTIAMKINETIVTETVDDHVGPDTAACVFWLKNRVKEKWSDQTNVKHSGNIGQKTDAELDAAIKELLEATNATNKPKA